MNREEELQRQVESGRIHEEDDDSNVYQHVFRALKQDPSYSLPSGFADKIMAKLEQKENTSNLADYIWLITGLLVIVGMFALTLFMTDFKIDLSFDWGFLKNISGFKGFLIFAIVFIAALHLIDKRFIRRTNNDIKKAIPVF